MITQKRNERTRFMTKKAHELEFISRIKRDGSGTIKLKDYELKAMLEHPHMKDQNYQLHILSLSERTYVAFNFNAFVVRVKN